MSQFALPELDAMQQIANIVSGLSSAECKRVSAWFSEYALADGSAAQTSSQNAIAAEDAPTEGLAIQDDPEHAEADEEEQTGKEYATFAEFYEAIDPKKGAQKAAVAGYWLEAKQGQQSWKASEVNKLLKSIDVKVSSMSIVLTNAVKARVPLVVELARLGDSERSRKTFCLSEQGLAYVEDKLS